MGLYLGLPTEFGTSKKEVFALILDKVSRRIHSWNNVFLSTAGRLTLICSVLSSLSIYSLSAFRMPVSVTSKIDSLISQFWWGGCKTTRGIHWSSRLFLHSSKVDGGLGIRHIGCFNQSLLAKLGWKILTDPESLLSRVVGNKYNISIEAFMGSAFSMPGSLSWGGGVLSGVLNYLRITYYGKLGFRLRWIYGGINGYMMAVHNICGLEVMPFVFSTPILLVDESDSVFWNFTKCGTLVRVEFYGIFLSIINGNCFYGRLCPIPFHVEMRQGKEIFRGTILVYCVRLSLDP
ncbi:uncharacterized protein LOC141654940 [Silene latifolia]|uniref:uncharacterized protein LOC141654940 n=1 Tax=Silene latifolia TaxID=37657 RepID=UPI003D788A64